MPLHPHVLPLLPFDQHPRKVDITSCSERLRANIDKAYDSVKRLFPGLNEKQILGRLRRDQLVDLVNKLITTNQIDELKVLAANTIYLDNLVSFFKNFKSLSQYLYNPSHESTQILNLELPQKFLNSVDGYFIFDELDFDIQSTKDCNYILWYSELIKNTLDICKDPLNETHIAKLNKNVNELNKQLSNKNYDIYRATSGICLYLSGIMTAASVGPPILFPMLIIGTVIAFLSFAALCLSFLIDNKHSHWHTSARKNINALNNHYQPSIWSFWSSRNLQHRHLQTRTEAEIPQAIRVQFATGS